FETPGLVESSSLELDLFSDIKERLEEEETIEIMTKTMDQYMEQDPWKLELITPFENPKSVFQSKRRLLETPGLVESSSLELNLFSNIKERLEEEETTEIMTKTMDQYMEQDPWKLQILKSKGAIPNKTSAYAKIVVQEMTEYSQKWHNGTSQKVEVLKPLTD
nr:hypothetical protein [Tanacetum cinerariifolium]